MKKIFRTTVFWIVIVFLFRSYVRLFDHNLGQTIAGRFAKQNPAVCISSGTGSADNLSGLNTQLEAIQTQLDQLSTNLSAVSLSTPASPASSFVTTAPTKVALYYFNQKEDAKLPPEQQINVDSLLPLYRTLPATDDILRDTIQELLKGGLFGTEKTQGFTTEFPNQKFRLISSHLDAAGTLTLEFTEVPGFTDGGSARMLIMANSIIKTAKQFAGVKKVVFVPETLFQP